MATYGLTSAGFVIKPEDQILSDIQDVELAQVSASLNVQPTAVAGIMNGIVADALFQLWQLAQALYNGMNPAGATGDQLTSLALITGTQREGAAVTLVPGCTVNVNAFFTAAAGTMFARIVNDTSGVLFTNKTAVTNSTGSAANETVDFECTVAGPVQCLANSLTVIATPLTGWNSITNPTDGTPGQNQESDSALRLRRAEDLANAGSSTADAIRSALLANVIIGVTDGVTVDIQTCAVFHNDSDTTDSNGIPPHCVECVPYQPTLSCGSSPSDDLAVATIIANEKAAGIGTNGTCSVVVTDSQGVEQTIMFTRPSIIQPTISIHVTVDPTTAPVAATIVSDVQAALAAFGLANYGPGSTIYPQHLGSAVFSLSYVLDFDTVVVSQTSFTFRQVPFINTANITVTHTP